MRESRVGEEGFRWGWSLSDRWLERGFGKVGEISWIAVCFYCSRSCARRFREVWGGGIVCGGLRDLY